MIVRGGKRVKIDSHQSKRDSILRAVSVMIGIGVNFLLAFISFRLQLPIALDTVGTIGMASIGGLFPGIMTAVMTNAFCTVFNIQTVYFGFVNALLAVFTAWFVREKSFRSLKNIFLYIWVSGLCCGVLHALIQWAVLGEGKNYPTPLLFVEAELLTNVIDKAVSLGAVLLILHFFPEELRVRIKNSGWRQRPLTVEEIKALNFRKGEVRHSIKRRMTYMLFVVALAFTFIMSWTGIRLYFKNIKAEKTEIARCAAKFTAEMIDPGKIGEYLQKGEAANGYRETEEMLARIRENAAGVKYLYVMQIKEDGCHIVFDLDTEESPGREPGEVIELDEAFQPYLSDLYEGKEIEPVESDGITEWLVTAYYPILDELGTCVGYAGADISLSYMSDYMSDFLLRVTLIMSGFFVLILAYGLWVTGVYMVYPIDHIVTEVERFIEAGDDQEQLDKSVRELRLIDIHTGDEVEKLYHAVCNMAANQAEQLRSIRHFSEYTARMQDGLIITMADLVENRDSDTGAHIQKTAAYVKIIVEGLKKKGYYAEKLTPKFMSDVVRSAPLHDVGKINIPDKVLNKPGKLTDEEYEIIKTHTTAGKDIMEKAIRTVEGENYLKEARNMAAYHHERWDGRGYPERLHGEVIPLAARIMAVADVFDALTSPRVYKPPFPIEKALAMIEEGAGSQFDPKCVEVFLESISEVKKVLKKYQENSSMEDDE